MENFDILGTIVNSCTRDQLIKKTELALIEKKILSFSFNYSNQRYKITK